MFFAPKKPWFIDDGHLVTGQRRVLRSTLHWPLVTKVQCSRAKQIGLPFLWTGTPLFGHFGSLFCDVGLSCATTNWPSTNLVYYEVIGITGQDGRSKTQ